jgi:hypothetical protein
MREEEETCRDERGRGNVPRLERRRKRAEMREEEETCRDERGEGNVPR